MRGGERGQLVGEGVFLPQARLLVEREASGHIRAHGVAGVDGGRHEGAIAGGEIKRIHERSGESDGGGARGRGQSNRR